MHLRAKVRASLQQVAALLRQTIVHALGCVRLVLRAEAGTHRWFRRSVSE